MKRKIIELGKGCLVVSLPAKWASANGLRKGDELDVSEQGTSMVLGSQKHELHRKTEIEIPRNSLLIKRYLAAIYRSGYDEAKITFIDPGSLKLIQRAVNDILIGFEIVEQGKSHCILKSIAGGLEEEFDTLLRRSFLVTKSMAENTLEAIKKSDFGRMAETYVLETTNNKLTLFCQRMIVKYRWKESRDSAFLFVLVYQLEKIADEIKYICDYIAGNRIRPSDDIISLYEDMISILDLMYSNYYKFSTETSEEIADQKKAFMMKSEELYQKVHKKELKIVATLVHVTQHIFNMLGCKLGMVV
ncbi:MAG: hypothetical protein ABH879_01340 [archaeon]